MPSPELISTTARKGKGMAKRLIVGIRPSRSGSSAGLTGGTGGRRWLGRTRSTSARGIGAGHFSIDSCRRRRPGRVAGWAVGRGRFAESRRSLASRYGRWPARGKIRSKLVVSGGAMDRSGSRAHEWQSREYAAYWVSDAESRDHERTEQLALLASLLPFPPDAPLRVLDLGAGYGIVTGTVLRAFPRARVTLFDLSEAMLEHARSRLAPHAAQLDYAVGDLSRPDWLDAVHGPYDAVVSAAVLHNLRDGPRIAAIYRELATILSPGGAFLCLDHVSAGGRRIERQFDALRPTRRHGDEAERAAAAEAAAHAHAGAAAAAD